MASPSQAAPDANDPEIPIADSPETEPAVAPAPSSGTADSTANQAPLPWSTVVASDEYRNASPQVAAQVFKRWTADAQGYVDSLKGSDPKGDLQAQQEFNSQVNDIAGKSFGFGIPQDDTGRLVTIGRAAALQPGRVPSDLYQNQYDTPDLPLTVPKAVDAAHSTDALVGAVSHLLTTPAKPIATAYDYLTNTQPGSTALDRGIEAVEQFRRNVDAANPGGVEGALAYSVPEAAGNIAAMIPFGIAGKATLAGAGEGTLASSLGMARGMAVFAGTDAAEETYHNAINDGATPMQAAESAGVSAAVQAGEILALGPMGRTLAGKIFGQNAEAFEKGLYKPTVGEMTKFMIGDAAGQAALGAGGQVAQNVADQHTYDPTRGTFEGAGTAAISQAFFSLVHLPGVVKAFMGNSGKIQEAAQAVVDAKNDLDKEPKPSGVPVRVNPPMEGLTFGPNGGTAEYTGIPDSDVEDTSHAENKALAQQMASRLSDEELTQITDSTSSDKVQKAVESVQETARTISADTSISLAQKQEAVQTANAYVDRVNQHEGSQQYFPLDPNKVITGEHSSVDGDVNTYYAGHVPEVDSVVQGMDAYDKATSATASDVSEPKRTIPLILASKYELAKRQYSAVIQATIKSAEPPTMGIIDDAKAIVSGEKTMPGTNKLADINDDLEKENAAPAEGETVEPDETQKEESVPVEPPVQPPADPVLAQAEQTLEPEPSAKPEGGEAAGSAPALASEPEGKGIVPATHLGDQEMPGGKPPIPLYNLHEDIEGHPKGSTVTGETLTRAGYDLPDKAKDAPLRERIMRALGKSAPRQKIVFSTAHDNPGWVDPAHPGKIFVNPDVLGEVVKGQDEGHGNPEPSNDYIRKLIGQKSGEEVIHSAQHAVEKEGAIDHAKIHDEASPEERQKTIEQYGSQSVGEDKQRAMDSIDASKATSPEDAAIRKTRFVQEHARQLLQRKAMGETTEDAFKLAKKPELLRYLHALYQKIKAHIDAFGASPELKSYLKNIEGVMADAKKAGQEIPELDSITVENPERFKGSQVAFSAKPSQDDASPVRDGFYSHLEQTIAAKMPGKASSEQIRAMLKGNGVKDDEMKWSGVDDYLTAHPVATKADLQRFLKEEGGVKIQTHVLGDRIPNEKREDDPIHNASTQDATKYAQYQLPGGSNYREQVFTMPRSEGWSFKEKKDSTVSVRDGDGKLRGRWQSMAAARHAFPDEMISAGPEDSRHEYTSSHFPDQPNYLAHLRLNDRTDAEGKPGTFIEEMQSDRHQAGREKGYQNAFSQADSDRLQALNDIWRPTEKEPEEVLSPSQLEEFNRLADKSDENNMTGRGQGVPDAPFRKTWHEFLFRKALGDAVASGKKWIGWTTGETQVDRYDLAKQVDSVKVRKRQDGTYNVAVTKKGETGLTPIKEVAQENELPDLIGKDLANKVTQQEVGPVKSYEGSDLKVGGEGMKGFYDNILPQYVSKYAKKWGVKPEVSDLKDPDNLQALDVSKHPEWAWTGDKHVVIRNSGHDELLGGGATPEEAMAKARGKLYGKDQLTADSPKIWKLPITDEMRKSIEETGQPLFSAKPSAMEEIKKTGSQLKDKFLGLKKFFPLDRIVSEWNWAEQSKGQKVDEAVKQMQKEVPNQLHDQGISLYIDAGGDMARLAKEQKMVEAAPKTKANDLYAKQLEAAQNLPPKALDWANHINKNKALLRDALVKWGVNIGFVDNYISHQWKLDSTGEPIRNLTGRSLKSSSSITGHRTVGSFFDGWRQGLEPAELRASLLWGHYMNEAMGLVNSRKLVAAAAKEMMPDGKPMVSPNQGAKWVDVANPQGKARLIMKPFAWGQYADYQKLDLPAFNDWYAAGSIDGKKLYIKSDMNVHPDVHEKFHNMFANSGLSEWWHKPTTDPLERVMRRGAKLALDDSRKWIKGTLLGGFPAFHIQQEAMGALGYGVNPIKAVLGTPEDMSHPRFQFFGERGMQFFPTSASLHSYQEGFRASNSLLLEGLKNIPGIKDAGGKYLAQIAEDSTNWTFKSFIPRLKLATAEKVFARYKARYAKELKSGTVTEDDLAYRTSYDVNNAYGHLNYADMGRNATRQHLMNIVALAPDFWEARVRHALAAAAGVTGSKANREQFRSFAVLGGGLYVAARVLNQIMDGDPHYEPENAFRIVNGNRAYQMRSYITDFAEMLSNTRTYFSGRLNPVARFVEEGASGVNYRGEKIQASDIWRDLLAQTVPIPLQSLTRGLSKTGVNSTVSPLEQFMGAMGVKVSRFAPAQQIYPLAKAWNEAQGKPVDTGTYPTSAYTPIKYALEDGDFDHASELYQALVTADKGNAGKVARGLVGSINHPFTGSKSDDIKFYQSLSDQDKAIYKAAVDRRQLLVQRFHQLIQQRNQPKGNP